MGWETRRNGRSYYYGKQRIGGKVVSQYAGSGPAAQLAEQMTECARVKVDMERASRRAVREEMEQEAASVEDFFQRVETLFRQTMEQAGYHRHNRGAWRKRRTGGKAA